MERRTFGKGFRCEKDAPESDRSPTSSVGVKEEIKLYESLGISFIVRRTEKYYELDWDLISEERRR